MRRLQIVCAVALMLACSALTAAAREPATPVDGSTLARMGFGRVQPLADGEGLRVRGKGSFAIVWGTGYGPIIRQHFAAGSSRTITPGGFFSGGGSFGSAR